MNKVVAAYMLMSTLIWSGILLISCTSVKVVALADISDCEVVPGLIAPIGWTDSLADGGQIVLVCKLAE